MPRFPLHLLLPLFVALAGCDQISALDGSKAREADGVAIGSACRQAGRAIEDCFSMNPDAPKASVFAGWKEMNDYMVQNKLESVTPQVPRPDVGKNKEEPKKDDTHAAAEEKPGTAEVATSAPGVPVVPATVNIPGLATAAPVSPPPPPAAPAVSAAPAAPATAAAPAGSSIALGGQNIPLSLPSASPATPPAIAKNAAPSSAGVPPAHH
ncbi:MAG TPA: hypothetical protein VH105_00575 [Burkholderiales bacterium]|nr:hypothetical protein [Burkholderiales bacterium]